MGALCCCPCEDDFEELARSSNPIYRHCICLRYFFNQLFNGYTAMFQSLEQRAAVLPAQVATSMASTGLGTGPSDNSISETFHLVPRPAPYDTGPRYSHLQREGLVSRREKSTGHSQDDTQMLRRNVSSSGMEHIGSGKKRNSAGSDEECKSIASELDKNLGAKAFSTSYILTNSEDEDVCPTCLEEYTPENPKIVTKCSHHFHLGCIYEWMERSDNCPICGKEMEFCETP